METKRPIDPGRRLNAFAAVASLALVNYSAAQTVDPEKPVTTRPKVVPVGAKTSTASVDSSVKRTGGFHDGVASAQGSTEQAAPPVPTKPQPTLPAPVPPVAPVQPTYVPQYQPTYPTYTPTAAPVAPVTGYYYYVQQPAPVAPLAPVAPVAPTAPANFFLPSGPAPMAAPVPQPFAPAAYAPAPQPFAPAAYALAPQPMAYTPVAYAPVPPQPVAYAPVAAQPVVPATGTANLTNQTVSVPTSRSTTRVRVRGPGMINAGLARIGERLVQLGRTRIQTVQETELESPLVQPSAGLATISTTSASPVAPVAPVTPVANPVPPQAPPPVVPQAPTPSPQGVNQKYSLLHHLMGHDD